MPPRVFAPTVGCLCNRDAKRLILKKRMENRVYSSRQRTAGRGSVPCISIFARKRLNSSVRFSTRGAHSQSRQPLTRDQMVPKDPTVAW
jgi:hypothetical protein